MLPDINWNELFFKYRFQILFFLIGAILIGLGLLLVKDSRITSSKIEVLESTTEGLGEDLEIVVEVAGAVEKPGVYKLTKGVRIEDALISAGGISADADRLWMERSLNRAAKLIDGQKIYIPRKDEQISGVSTSNSGGYQTISSSQGSGLVNVNAASQKELESLWGIGPVTAQNIVEQRPYSSVEELLTKKILKSNVYERNKDKLSVY
ncbi:ComEA family DNA-binding protein [Candidatus Woesebacteria bacterium]|jgi:competence protein ComEA|nr:MAG: ComEA family DNA-binding protein [Candidatus Woesebacteria bacterium]